MDLKGNGINVSVEAAEQSDQWLIDAAQEIREAAEARGLEVPAFAGVIAVESDTEVIREPLDRGEVKTGVVDQLTAANTAYTTVLDSLNDARKKKDRIEVADAETIEREFTDWFTDEKLELVASAMEADPELRFTLVATPNVTATKDEVIGVAREFGKDQPYETYVYDEIYGRYTPEQLSGTNPENGNSVVFSLVPSKFSPELDGSVAQQRETLAKMQADNPDLRVPSVLEDVAHWQTLRAQGDSLTTGDVFDRTYVRHFDLPEQRIGGWDDVPGSCVDDGGKPGLSDSRAGRDRYGRVAVG